MLSTATPLLRRTFVSTTRSNSINKTFTPVTVSRTFHSTIRKMTVHELKDKEGWNSAKAGSELVVLDCFAEWCGPCKIIAPQVAKFSETYTDAKFYKIDVDDVPDVAQELGVRAMPTFYLFKNGKKVDEIVGANPKALQSAIEANK